MAAGVTDEEMAFRRAILADPADDAPRLVYADWCRENGRWERGEFIDAQIALTKPEPKHHVSGACAFGYANPECPRCKYGLAMLREIDLLEQHWHDWSGRVATYCGNFHNEGAVGVTFRRGFVHAVSAPLTSLIGGECRCGSPHIGRVVSCPSCGGTGRTPGVLAGLVQREPVSETRVTDREPYYNGAGFSWFDVGRSRPSADVPQAAELPGTVFAMLGLSDRRYYPYPTAEDAHVALGNTLLALARTPRA